MQLEANPIAPLGRNEDLAIQILLNRSASGLEGPFNESSLQSAWTARESRPPLEFHCLNQSDDSCTWKSPMFSSPHRRFMKPGFIRALRGNRRGASFPKPAIEWNASRSLAQPLYHQPPVASKLASTLTAWCQPSTPDCVAAAAQSNNGVQVVRTVKKMVGKFGFRLGLLSCCHSASRS